MTTFPKETDILNIDAGMAGLTVAEQLHAEGHRTIVIDKKHGVGGRLASRRIGQATLDRGAQLFTAKELRLAATLLIATRTSRLKALDYILFGSGLSGLGFLRIYSHARAVSGGGKAL